MKTMTKKLGAIILALAMCFSLTCVAFAAAGDYTITVENANIDQTYTAYKIFDATYDGNGGVSYTISSTSNPSLYNAVLSSDVFTLTQITGTDDYYVTASGTDEEIIAALEAMDIPSLVSASASVTAEDTSIVLDVGEPGYYYITTTTDAVVTITTAAPKATVIDKNETVGGDKFYKYTTDADGNVVEKADAALGSELNFDITSNVPLYAGDQIVTEYQFTDTLGDTGLEIEIELESEEEGNEHHITIDNDHYYADDSLINKFVTMTDSSGVKHNLTDVAYNITLEFTDVSYDEETGYIVCGGFILTYYTYDTDKYVEGDASTFDTSKYLTDLTIDIVYTTYVTDNASHTETNTAQLDYWTIPYSTIPTPENPPTPATSQTSTDYMYEWDLKIVKIDGNESDKYLDGAEFTLVGENLSHVKVSTTVTYTEIDPADMQSGITYYYKLADGTYTTTAPTDDTRSEYDPTNPGPYERSIERNVVEDASDSTHTAYGETSSDGTLVFDGLTSGTYTLTEIVAPDGYNLLENPITIVVTFDSDSGTFTATVDGNSATINANGELEFNVENFTGTELPSTGGIGTTIFYIIGGVLVAGAVVVLITRRRMSNAD